MKQYRIAFIIVFVLALMAVAQSHAQTVVDGQPSVLREDKGQSNYVYDLKLLIKKSKDNIKSVNEKIKDQAVLKRNQQREEKAREYYQQALKLQEEGRLEEARQLFDKAIRITEHPEMKYFINESAHRSKLQEAALERQGSDQDRRLSEDQKLLLERADSSYVTAVTLYKQQKFHEAKDEFQLVEEMVPDYKAVRSYLQIIEQDIAQTDHLNMKEQKKEIERQQQDVEVARLREKELWRKEIDRKEDERQVQLRKQAQAVYEEAVKLYEEHKYLASREKFQQVEWVVPDFKATRAYLTRIENDVQDEKKQITQERQRELEKQRWEDILKEKKLEEERRKALGLREQEKLSQVKDQADFVYQAAVVLFEKDQLAQAKDKFDEVEKIYPNFKSARDYLKRIEQLSAQSVQRDILKKKTEEERRMWDDEMARRKEEKEKFKQITSEADAAYEDAMRFYQTGRLIEAKEKFLEVDQRVPDYKSTRNYLKRIDEDIELLVKTQKTQETFAVQREEIEKMRATKEKADFVYTQALAAYDSKDFMAAKAKFNEAESIFPDYKKSKSYLNRIDEDIRLAQEAKVRVQREQEAEMAYVQALSFYQAGQFAQAKRKFVAVEAVIPNYKQTSDYLEKVDDDILHKKESDLARMKEQQVQGLYNQAMAFYQNNEFSDAKDKFLQVEVIYPGYKDTTRILEMIDVQIEKQKKDAEERHRTDQAEQLYAQALGLYQSTDYLAAKEKFVKVEVISSDYKDTLKYLARIDADIARKKKEEDVRAKTQLADPVYVQAIALYKDSNFLEAKSKFFQVQSLFPGYKDTALLLARIDKDEADLEARLAREDRMRKADALYTDAVKMYVNHQFVEAKAKFMELTAVDPAYKNVRPYLSRIDNDISEEALAKKRLLAQQQAAEPYAQAVTLYHDGDFEAAKAKFLDVLKFDPDYKKTRFYLSHIDQDMHAQMVSLEKDRQGKAESLYVQATALMAGEKIIDALKKFNDVEAVYSDYKATRSNIEKLRKMSADKGFDISSIPASVPLKPVVADDAPVAAAYKEAVQLYKDKQYVQASAKFAAVDDMKPGYRSTRKYLDSIKEIQKDPLKASDVVSVTASVDAPPKADASPAVSVALPALADAPRPISNIPVSSRAADQALKSLAARSNVIYRQIKSLSEDKGVADLQRTFGTVDRLIVNLEAEHRRLADEVARQKKADQEAAAHAKSLEKETASKQARMTAQKAALEKKQAKSKVEQEAEDRQAKFIQEQEELRKRERAQLELAKDAQSEAQLKAEVLYQQALGFFRKKDYQPAYDRFMDVEKVFPNYKETARYLLRIGRIQGETSLAEAESKDRLKIKDLAEKATALNMEILDLSRKKEYQFVEQRFNDLESILKEIQGIKLSMVQRRDEFEASLEKKMAGHTADGNKQTSAHAEKSFGGFASPREHAQALFRQGQQFYAVGSYPEARVKFIDSSRADPAFKASLSYIQRIDRILAKKDFEVPVDQQKNNAAPAIDLLPDPKRAAQVSQEGAALYKAKRYREARIKYEELAKVGSGAERQSAGRYLNLIDQALNQEKIREGEARRMQQDRYMEEGRIQAKLKSAHGKEVDIRREQDIREVEEENLKQRRLMLEKKVKADALAEKEGRTERAKFIKEPGQEKASLSVKSDDDKGALSKDKAAGVAVKERHHLDQLESPQVRERRLKEKKDAGHGLSLAKKIEQEREKSKKDKEDGLTYKNQETVESILKEASVVMDESQSKVVIDPAMAEQKRRLEEQRTALRKDFEDGVDRLYAGAIELYKKKLFDEARNDFLQVDLLIKGYKKTAQYLKDIDRVALKTKPAFKPLRAAVKVETPTVAAATPSLPAQDRKRVVTDMLDSFDINAK